MKRTMKYLLTLSVLVAMICSCNRVLESTPSESYSEGLIWSNRTTANSFVYDVYGNVFGGYIGSGNLTWEARTPNMIGTVDGYSQNGFNQGNYDATNDFGYFGGYGTIRKINLIIEKAQEYKGKGLSETDTKELVAEGKFLRAMYYFRQARGVGRFVFVDRVLNAADTVGDGLKKFVLTKSIEESYDIVIKDLEESMVDMTSSKVAGRLNKWCGYALMTEVTLTAAAYVPSKAAAYLAKGLAAGNKLMTESGYSLHPSYGEIFNDKNANANSEIILARYWDYTLNNVQNTDMQLTCPNMNNDQIRSSFASPFMKVDKSLEAWPTFYPTQTLADDYLMIDKVTGEAVKWSEASQVKAAMDLAPGAAGYFPDWTTKMVDGKKIGTGGVDRTSASEADIKRNYTENMTEFQLVGIAKTPGTDLTKIIYADRDARFADTFVLDGSEWNGETASTRYWGNMNRWCSGSGSQAYYKTKTNYYWRKSFYNANVENKVILNSNKAAYHRVILRLGRALLNVAEIKLRMADLGIGGVSYSDAVATFNLTRTVHGKIPGSKASTAATAWNDYITERRVELTGEQDFYWSCIRWGLYGGNANRGAAPKSKIGWLTDEPTFIEIAPDGSSFIISRILFGEHYKRDFREDRQYLLPIPNGTLQAYPFLGAQNPGW